MTDESMEAWNEFSKMRRQRKLSKMPSQLPENTYTNLLTLYRSRIRRKIATLPSINQARQEVEQCLDLLGAILEYRKEPDREELIAKDPTFEPQRVYINQLWDEFEKNSPDDMYELVNQMFREIDGFLGGKYYE